MSVKCPVCGREFLRTINLKAHYWDAHGPTCLACGKKFSGRNGLARHCIHVLRDVDERDKKHAMMLWLAIGGGNRDISERTRKWVKIGEDEVVKEMSR